MERRRGRLAALAIFAHDVYAPGLHIAFAAAWFLALDGALAVLSGQPVWRLTYLPVGVASYFLVLFYLRVLDEWKDLDYDRIHNPGRPLVRGRVSLHDLYWFLGTTAAAVIALHIVFPGFSGRSLWPLAIITADLGYGVLLVGLERISKAVKESIFLNLLVTYPVNVALSVYSYAAYMGRTGSELRMKPILLIAAFALAFLHYEFARKTAWSWQAKPGKRLYSSQLGERTAAMFTLLFAAAAVTIAAGLLAPVTSLGFAPLLAFVPALAGAWRFHMLRDVRVPVKPSAPMTPFAMAFLTVYYVTILAVAATRGVML